MSDNDNRRRIEFTRDLYGSLCDTITDALYEAGGDTSCEGYDHDALFCWADAISRALWPELAARLLGSEVAA